MKRVLIVSDVSFDFYMLYLLIIPLKRRYEFDLLAPDHLIASLSSTQLSFFKNTHSYNPKFKFVYKLSNFKSLLKTTRWLNRNKLNYSHVIFGAYRSEFTSVALKYLVQNSNLKILAIKQGVDKPLSLYSEIFSIKNLFNRFFFLFFGYSYFKRFRLVQSEIPSKDSDFWFLHPVWASDPFNYTNSIYTIGFKEQSSFLDNSKYVWPNVTPILSEYGNRSKVEKKGILIIGERTPMTPSWNTSQHNLLFEFFKVLAGFASDSDQKIYLRPRKNLTESSFYSTLNPIFLNPDEPFDDQLLRLNPKFVFSVKSTACKAASFYGFNSAVFYSSFKLSHFERIHLDYLFGDGFPIANLSSPDKLVEFLNNSHSINAPFSSDNFSFYKQFE
jgi:hypothetical protein